MKMAPPRKKKAARVEIIPLIDVVFFCLATFVLLTMSMTKMEGIRVDLPSAVKSEPHELKKSVTLSVDGEGQLYWGQELITFDAFVQQLTIYKETTPAEDRRIVINADRSARFSNVLTLLDQIRRAEIEQVTFESVVPRNAAQ